MKFALAAFVAAAGMGATAQAAVVDQFQCQVQLFDAAGHGGPRAEGVVSGVRQPMAPDPSWIDGVTATTAQVGLSVVDPDTGITATIRFDYQHYVSATMGRAGQQICFTPSVTTPDQASDAACAHPIVDTPFDPVDYSVPTQLSAQHNPIFAGQALTLVDGVIYGGYRWTRYAGRCEHTGTFE
jgi:hypothetical protein